MKRKIFRYFGLAAKITARKGNFDKRDYLLGSVGVRYDGAIVSAVNGSDKKRNRKIHSEYRLLNMIDHHATVYIVRIRAGDESLAMARPCPSCFKALISKKTKKIIYSIDDHHYGVINIKYSKNIKMKEYVKYSNKSLI